ncbi:sortase domain-containing protein [Naasia aerilata]|uniref:Sortase family protein n=1 Tax=Naasia aerilata TaxID=1162966 RepID=A0ABN6XQ93_9MICO|nr:sortase [Naasia aerilata]BDZ47031.1 hypothetical protein GCM10025866_29400 [Naasia aerilata]
MRLPAVAGILFLAGAVALVAVPLLDAAGASAGGVGAAGTAESARLVAVDDGAAPGTRDAGWDPATPAASPAVPYGDGIGVLVIPALGSDYRRVVAEGVGLDVLDRPEIGHFPGTAGPGEVGNFALAGHRSTALLHLADVGPGDRVHLQTADGWYTYEVRDEHTVVAPTAVEVLSPCPARPAWNRRSACSPSSPATRSGETPSASSCMQCSSSGAHCVPDRPTGCPPAEPAG